MSVERGMRQIGEQSGPREARLRVVRVIEIKPPRPRVLIDDFYALLRFRLTLLWATGHEHRVIV